MSSPRRNPNVPAIPTVVPNAMVPAMRAMKEGIESLSGQRGALEDRAVTFNDLIRMGVITSAAAARATGTASTTTIVEASRDYVTPEDYGAIGDDTSRPAGTHLGLATLEELQEYNGGVFSFADSLDNEMDWLAVQAAFYAGKPVRWRENATYRLDKLLMVRNGRTQVFGGPCNLMFDQMAEIPDDGSNLLTNPSFDSGSTGWQNTALGPRVDVVFSGGKATFTDPPVTYAPDETHFGQFGQEVTIPAGYWTVRARVAMSEGASGGFRGGRIMGMGFYKDGPGVGGWDWGDPLYPISAAGATAASPFDGWIEMEVYAAAEVTAWFTFSGFNCDWEVQEARISPMLLNYAIWCSGDYDGSGYTFDETIFSNCQIFGPATGDLRDYTGPAIDGVLHKSFVADERASFERVHIRNFRRGVVISDNNYLNRHEACSIGNCVETIYFKPGSRNAGENMRFTNCVLFNSDLAINADGGGEWNFVNCSIDYCRRLVYGNRGALINLHGHHFEFNPPETRIYLASVAGGFNDGETITGGTSGATALVIDETHQDDDVPYLVISVQSGTFVDGETLTGSESGSEVADGEVDFADYLFDLRQNSSINFVSGEMLQAGYSHRGGRYAARLESTLATISFGDVWGYNWKTASGDWATGAGRILFNNHLGPGNALMPDRMMLRNTHMDAFAGNGGVRGEGTWEDMGFETPLSDNVGLDFAAHSNEDTGAALTRGVTPWEQSVSGDLVVYRTAGRGSLKLEYNAAYAGGTELRVYVPVQPGKIVLSEFWFSKPDTKAPVTLGPYTSGVPTAGDTIYVYTTDTRSLAIIEDKHAQWIGGSGPRPGWTVTLANVTGDPGGVSNAVWNATHAVVERLDAYRFTVDLGGGNEATSTDSNAGGVAIEATYSQTSALVFVRQYWVQRIGRDAVGRNELAQAQYQGEENFDVAFDPHDWTRVNYNTWYAGDNVIPDSTEDRYGRGRAPQWATHFMLVFNWQNIREMDPAAPPPWYLTDFYANVL